MLFNIQLNNGLWQLSNTRARPHFNNGQVGHHRIKKAVNTLKQPKALIVPATWSSKIVQTKEKDRQEKIYN